ncbi:MAG: pyrimidine/purine nucleoside phosphorylase [Candidatus Hydrogenedentes bacterium]|nr:pyrimidine/purine nucleoside phosphorylase [Candidatus Hydrogenedentota bacterium]
MQITEKFENVTMLCKANVYFEGKVVSYTLLFTDGSRKTVGLIYPGTYHFGTDAPERMEVIAGTCTVTLDGSEEQQTYEAGTYFDVPGNSAFDIHIADGIMEYVCSYM